MKSGIASTQHNPEGMAHTTSMPIALVNFTHQMRRRLTGNAVKNCRLSPVISPKIIVAPVMAAIRPLQTSQIMMKTEMSGCPVLVHAAWE